MRAIGPYEVIRPLGEGGFARTFEARHPILGTNACIKISRRAEDADLFLREARMLWDLHHPSLPAIRDVIRLERGLIAIVMRFVEGESLEDATPISIDCAMQVLGRLLRVLKVLHHRGVVHNDIKPANIILEPDRHGVVLVDFGISSFRPGSSSRAAGYTVGFTAPEVSAGRPPLPESDLYSLGMSVLHALGGHIERRVLPAGCPDDLLQFLVTLTRRSPSDRPRWDTDDPLASFQRIWHSRSCLLG